MALISQQQQRRIDEFICAGQLIQAIKCFREATGAGLAEAKEAVESRAAELAGDQHRQRGMSLRSVQSGPGAKQWEPVDEQLLAGRKIEAIRMHREQTGCGLKEAKDAIDARELEIRERLPTMSRSQKKGCTTVLAVMAVAVYVLVLLFR